MKEGELSSGLTKNELLDIVNSKHLTTAYASYDISRKYNYKLMLTPPYHCEPLPIEKVWLMVKNPTVYSPDFHEAVGNLKEKLDTVLRNIGKSYFDLE